MRIPNQYSVISKENVESREIECKTVNLKIIDRDRVVKD